MEDGYMLRVDPLTGIYEQVKVEPEVLEEWEEEVQLTKTTVKPPVKIAEKKK